MFRPANCCLGSADRESGKNNHRCFVDDRHAGWLFRHRAIFSYAEAIQQTGYSGGAEK
jgi:hypothetical protein